MTYCSEQSSTWATVDDLYNRFGDEYIDKLAIRRIYDTDLEQYVADESEEGKLKVIELALCDAKSLILRKLSCYYTQASLSLLDSSVFKSIYLYHIKLTIETLKAGGDCSSCDCISPMEEFFKCGPICSEDGNCLVSNKTFISVSESKFCCELMGKGCKCCR